MQPPKADRADPARVAVTSKAAFVCPLETIVKRADFLRASRARRQAMPGFILQARKRGEDENCNTPIRIGYTCSKKVGNAVARNRAKGRLREIARAVLSDGGQPGWDYVLVGRREQTATRPFERLKADLSTALEKIHR